MCMCGGSKKFPESAIERLFWYKHVLKLMHMRGVQKVHEKCTLWKIWISNIFYTKINPSLSSIFWCISWRPTISVSRDKSGMYFSNTGCSVIQGFFFSLTNMCGYHMHCLTACSLDRFGVLFAETLISTFLGSLLIDDFSRNSSWRPA